MNTHAVDDRLRWARQLRPVAAAGLLAFALAVLPGQAQPYWIIHSCTGPDGSGPQIGVLSGGVLYGVAGRGGPFNLGAVFAVNTDGSGYRLLHCFSGNGQGQYPFGPLVSDGSALYGVASGDGTLSYGIAFKVNLDGSGYAVLKTWNDSSVGAGPGWGLTLGGTTLYGTLQQFNSAAGAVFRLNTDGSGYTVLKQLNGTGATNPVAGLVPVGSELVGTSEFGGTGDNGTLFKLNTNGSGFTILKQFAGPPEGACPLHRLAASGSTLYGVTYNGGTFNVGTIFKINTDGTAFSLLKGFTNGLDGGGPTAGLVLCGSTLYGVTGWAGGLNHGTLFSLDTNGGNYTVVRDFTDDDANQTGVMVSSGSTLYGSAGGGGPQSGDVFGLALPSLSPVMATLPRDQVAVEGEPVSFTAYASGAPTLAYQWFFNTTNLLPGATSNILQFPAQAWQSGTYSLVVTNGYGAVTSAPAALTVVPIGTTPVTSFTETGLRAALAGTSPVTFSGDGGITLGSVINITKNIVVDGTGHQVVLDGGKMTPLFCVQTNVTFSLVNVTLTAGAATNGGAIWNLGGTVNLVGVTVLGNVAHDKGGGVCNQGGRILATNCVFGGNVVGASDLSSTGLGGAVESEGAGAQAGFYNCLFSGNTAGSGGNNRFGTPRQGGAIYNEGLATARLCAFRQNSAVGGVVWGGNYAAAGAEAGGGAVANAEFLLLERCLVASNAVTGGQGGAGMGGQPNPFYSIPAGPGGPGGNGDGAGLFNEGTATAINCTFAGNQTVGGQGSDGGSGGQAYFPKYGLVIGIGGNGGNGGNGSGAIYSDNQNGELSLINCTVAFNSTTGGAGGRPGFGNWYLYQPLPGTNGTASGSLRLASGSLVNSVLAGGVPRNFDGALTDLGHNLSSDASCPFTRSSLGNTDPKLGPLANNGGTSLTLALLPGSPAIDAGDCAAAPPNDQRGFPRPAGAAADIGAYEFCLPAMLRASAGFAGGIDLTVYGTGGQSWLLLTSTNLVNWQPLATNQLGLDGTWLFHHNPVGSPKRFYRALLPE